ncbi:hypothetical protein IMG5_067870 [Ichthyophthirius multifiliis]|uniref:Transmembrane protein n=1 Tax=Ichthyophthirius multifiliis TaxID=5932 RepID=G0QPG8_ICHMU|nr:hypothetical protein IMG5_067870 [Ichthyophthirius multifiliis]EGR32881.1 hypothetical protein IMG5_067870 [Ichthyophthirius multifiliis]|eukprot:XP_004036867.1 hypothetical protein IMG5_067870 [Ichthyophthirius multifiliis]
MEVQKINTILDECSKIEYLEDKKLKSLVLEAEKTSVQISKLNIQDTNCPQCLYGEQYGNNIFDYPQGLEMYLMEKNGRIQMVFDQTKKAFVLKNWASGQDLNAQILLKMIDYDQRQTYFDEEEDSYIKEMQIEINVNNSSVKNQYQKVAGNNIQKYNKNLRGFLFDKIIFENLPSKDSYLELQAISQEIQKGSSLLYKYLFYVQMRDCELGEALIQGKCIKCQEATFSIQMDSTECKKCTLKEIQECVDGFKIKIYPGYWRKSFDSDIIIECKNLISNCLGGFKTGDQSCAEGHIGALCESCDIYGNVWGQSWANSSPFKCGLCSEINYNSIKVFAISIYTLIALLFSVKSAMPSIINQYISLASCREIGDLMYVKQNTAYECYTQNHIKWIFSLVIPVLSIIGVIIPLYFFYNLYRGKSKLDSPQMKYKLGFLYIEYKKNAYFWEILKIVEKTFVLITINFYDSNLLQGLYIQKFDKNSLGHLGFLKNKHFQ